MKIKKLLTGIFDLKNFQYFNRRETSTNRHAKAS
jgi:hypothetical protein